MVLLFGCRTGAVDDAAPSKGEGRAFSHAGRPSPPSAVSQLSRNLLVMASGLVYNVVDKRCLFGAGKDTVSWSQTAALLSGDHSAHGVGFTICYTTASISVRPHVPRGTRCQAPMITDARHLFRIQEWGGQLVVERVSKGNYLYLRTQYYCNHICFMSSLDAPIIHYQQ